MTKNVNEAYRALVVEIERVFPNERVGLLAQPLSQIEQALVESPTPTPTLDLLEDLLESLLRDAGWPERAS